MAMGCYDILSIHYFDGCYKKLRSSTNTLDGLAGYLDILLGDPTCVQFNVIMKSEKTVKGDNNGKNVGN